ncbi:hypothetical protein [Pseudomonas kribbensis]|uniref:hypothetical protein n=1 Tax=Pseudomonas kribbensis TaxID=1628086 RepID=UPI003BF77D54
MDSDENALGKQTQRAVLHTTDNQTGQAPTRDEPEVPMPPYDEAPIEEDMSDVEAANSVASEHPESGRDAGTADDDDQNREKESRNGPASDPEAGA